MAFFNRRVASLQERRSFRASRSNRVCNCLTNWDLFSLVLPTLAVSPLLFLEAMILSSKQHLQFFPVAFLSAAWLIRREGKAGIALSKLRFKTAICLAVVGLGCCYCALGLYSPWLAHLSLLVSAFAWCLGKYSNLTLIRITGICGLMAVTLPPPFNGDQLVVHTLQSLSTSASSLLMDIMQILHVPNGNVVDIQMKSLFVEEACSGVDSQYALMAVAGILLLLSKAGLFVSLATIATVPLWAIIGNLLRILSIVLGIEFFGVDLSAGILHSLLGLCTFSLAAWAHWSSVQFLNFIVLRTSRKDHVECQAKCENGSHVYISDLRSVSSSNGLPSWILIGPGILLLIAPILIVSEFGSAIATRLPKLTEEVIAMLPAKNDISKSARADLTVRFSTESRSRDDFMGQHSCTWTCLSDDTHMTFSLDLPFRNWHELWRCYEATGWTDLGYHLVDCQENGNKMDWPYIEVQLENSTGEFAVLLFSHFAENGEPILYNEIDGGLGNRNARWILPTILKQLRQMQKPEPVTFQFQLLSRTSEPATEEQIAQFRSLFFEAREKIREKSIPAFRKLMGEE